MWYIKSQNKSNLKRLLDGRKKILAYLYPSMCMNHGAVRENTTDEIDQ